MVNDTVLRIAATLAFALHHVVVGLEFVAVGEARLPIANRRLVHSRLVPIVPHLVHVVLLLESLLLLQLFDVLSRVLV